MSNLNPSGINPCGYRVVIRPETIPEKTSGGIILPEMQQEKESIAQVYGEVIAIGPDAWKGADAPWAKVGDKIIYGKFAGLIFPGADGNKYRIINDKDVVATVLQSTQESE